MSAPDSAFFPQSGEVHIDLRPDTANALIATCDRVFKDQPIDDSRFWDESSESGSQSSLLPVLELILRLTCVLSAVLILSYLGHNSLTQRLALRADYMVVSQAVSVPDSPGGVFVVGLCSKPQVRRLPRLWPNFLFSFDSPF